MSLSKLKNKLLRQLEIIEELEQLEKKREELKSQISLEFGRSGGSIVEKYVKCGKNCKKCPHGPYYYLVYREGGKQKWKYLGKAIKAVGDSGKSLKIKQALDELKRIDRRIRKLEKELTR